MGLNISFKSAWILGAGFYLGYTFMRSLDKAIGRIIDEKTKKKESEEDGLQ